jgi:hypothetical protein
MCFATPAPGLPRLTLSAPTDGPVTGMLETYGRCQQPAVRLRHRRRTHH